MKLLQVNLLDKLHKAHKCSIKELQDGEIDQLLAGG